MDVEGPASRSPPYGLPGLQDRQIRLLRVQTGDRTGVLHCAVSIHSLGDKERTPEFSALSYTWGPCHRGRCSLQRPTSDMIVLCNDERVHVTENLHDFLCYWASSHESPTYIWIDALCIDQHNISEQSHQVNIMGQIYSAASQVLVWLGPEDKSVHSAFDIMERLNLLEPEARSALKPHEVTPDNVNPLLDLARWKALSHLFSRTWFSRAWIIQEAVFARNCRVICGPHTTPWETLANVSQFLATSSWTIFLRDSALFENNGDQWYTTPARLTAQHKTWKGSHKDGLLYALIRARPSACQDPRDKVYSQLHLGQADIFPDYNLSESQVYINTAVYILEQTGSMLLLTCVEGDAFQTPAFCLPSWVPDWSVQKFVGLRMTGYRHFHAAIRRSPTYSVSPDKRILDVESVELDDIVEISDKKRDLRSSLHASTFWRLISRLPSTYTTTHGIQSREEVVWRTLVTNRGNVLADCRAQYPAPDDLQYSFRDWILWRYAAALEEPATFPVPSTNHNILPTQDELEDTRKRAASDPAYLTALAHRASLFDLHYSHAMLQRPYRTKKGYFGIGTQCLREGDSVWVVSGCRVPIILRPIEGSKRHRLVGGSYLHGFMDGEALNDKCVNFEIVSLE